MLLSPSPLNIKECTTVQHVQYVMNSDVHVQFYYFISLFKFFLCSPQINQNLVRAEKFDILFIRWTN